MHESENPLEISRPSVVEHAVRRLYLFWFNPNSVRGSR